MNTVVTSKGEINVHTKEDVYEVQTKHPAAFSLSCMERSGY